ncbi:hypothetical protein ACROYT_G021779 [Oculina patagonica]
MAPKVVVISGCSSGIGLATALFLAKDAEKRFKVYATMRNLARKGQLEEEGKKFLGDTLIIKQMDVCSDESVEKAVREVIDEEGRIDVVFNNAGMVLFTVFECIPVEVMKTVFEVNFFGTARLIKAVLPHMKAKESGLIINNSSHAGVAGFPYMEVYSSSKFAVEGLTESLAPTLRQFNIRCVIIEPGPVNTPMKDAASGAEVDTSTADQKTLLIKERVLNRWGQFWAQPGKVVSAELVAEVVKEAILNEDPNFRYQTNKEYCPDEIAAKLADINGNKSVDLITKRFCAE